MTTPGAPEPAAPEVRASDAERGEVVHRLQAALAEGRITVDEFSERSGAAYTARTHAELVPLTGDLPVRSASPGSGPVARPSPAVLAVHGPVDRPESAAPVLAVFGRAARKGRWVPAEQERATAVFGGVELDYRDADLGTGTLELRAIALFGGVDITVPDDVRVELSGFAIFGGREVTGNAGAAAGPGAPVLRIRAIALFGGVMVRAQPRR